MFAVAPSAGAWIEIWERTHKMPRSKSLPPRERGLKFPYVIISDAEAKSLPPRERGLKFIYNSVSYRSETSLPPRERGLK